MTFSGVTDSLKGPNPERTISLDEAAAFLVQLRCDNRADWVAFASLLDTALSESSIGLDHPLYTARNTIRLLLEADSLPGSVLVSDLTGWFDEAAGCAGTIVSSRSSDPADPAAYSDSELLSPDIDIELLKEFLTETRENLQSAEAALLSLEGDPANSDNINIAFRAFHTIKGTSAFLGLTYLNELSHYAESLFSKIRDRKIQCDGRCADLAFRSVDALRTLVSLAEQAIDAECPIVKPLFYDELICLLEKTSASDLVEPATVQTHPAVPPVSMEIATKPPGGHQERTVRVSTLKMNELINMVGELVIAHTMVAEDPAIRAEDHQTLLKNITRSSKIVRDLQDLSMSMRMVPLRPTFERMSRLVRDLSHELGKRVVLTFDDQDTEIDRSMVDVINEALVHLIRNAIDHGIELPNEREAANKSATGNLLLSAFHSGGSVVVRISDDGKGLNREKLLDKGIAIGTVPANHNLSDKEIYNLIFSPGFSTADKLSSISGRGVGMDIAKKGVELLRGQIDVHTEKGKGCTFEIRLPATLAIADAILVKVGSDRYIIPTVNILVTLSPSASHISTIAGRGEMVMVHNEFLPIIRLHRVFEIEDAVTDPLRGLLIVVADGDSRSAILVDHVLGQQQVVAKSLGTRFRVPGVSGAAILGDGRVGLIIDVRELVVLGKQAVPSAWSGKGEKTWV